MHKPLCPQCGNDTVQLTVTAAAYALVRTSPIGSTDCPDLEIQEDVRHGEPIFSDGALSRCECGWTGTMSELLPTVRLAQYTAQQKQLVANALAEQFPFLIDPGQFAPRGFVDAVEEFFGEMGGYLYYQQSPEAEQQVSESQDVPARMKGCPMCYLADEQCEHCLQKYLDKAQAARTLAEAHGTARPLHPHNVVIGPTHEGAIPTAREALAFAEQCFPGSTK